MCIDAVHSPSVVVPFMCVDTVHTECSGAVYMCRYGMNAVLAASREGKADVVSALLEAGAELNSTDYRNWSVSCLQGR